MVFSLEVILKYFVPHVASSGTKDCVQLLKLLGVPIIQVLPV